MMAFKRLAAAALFLQAVCSIAQASEISSSTQSEKQCGQPAVVTVFVEEPPRPSVSATANPSKLKPALPSSIPATNINTTATYRPITAPDVDCSRPENFIPSSNISVYYGSPTVETRVVENATIDSGTGSGLINMTLAMNGSTIVLEYIDSILNVTCANDSLTVTFNGAESFGAALSAWTVEDTLLMVTNHQGSCDTEFERGFYLVEKISSDPASHSITGHAFVKEIADIAKTCEMTFSSMPAATLSKRLVINPSLPITFGHEILGATIYEQQPWVKVVADEASFHANITFSGKLNYNFWGFKLEELYFDIDTAFDADLQMSAFVAAEYKNSFKYAPAELEYILVNVPGIVALGPGLGFSIGLDLETSAEVNVTAGAGISLPNGNVHLDFIGGAKASQSGWTPQYTSFAKMSQQARVGANVTADLDVQLALKFLGGLIDLSSGLIASPGFNNEFTLASGQNISDKEPFTVVPINEKCGNGVNIKSDFTFSLTGYITKFFSNKVVQLDIPITDKCYNFN
ncbi:hypothetical protein GQ44DRAFT_310820 [Phaeosphaeriaceae sp. PMI808]|nr:hypothetical protein GQ44DRAFT_310820 [Phaeosphaeriaceae sp. PMI808]